MTTFGPAVRRLGRQPYVPILERMRAFTEQRAGDAPDELWLLEHEPVFTLGQAGKAEHVLDACGIAIEQSDRGGQVTYHGPGQVVVYTLLDLRRAEIGIRDLVHGLEQCVVDVLATFGVAGVRRPGAPGVYVDDAKISALGLRIRGGCSYHGVALNVAMDLAPFARINPCGYAGLAVTDLAHLGVAARPVDVGDLLVRHIIRHYQLQSEPA